MHTGPSEMFTTLGYMLASHPMRCCAGASLLMLLLGCGSPQPSAPLPPKGYRTEKVSYEPKPHPHAILLACGEFRIAENETLKIPLEELPVLERDHFFAIEGIAIHPDDRMTAGLIELKLLAPGTTKDSDPVVVGEATSMAKGEKGRLVFRTEVRVPKSGPKYYTIRITFLGEPPGIQAGDTPRMWKVPLCETRLQVADGK